MVKRAIQYVAFVRNVMVGRKGVSRAALLDPFDFGSEPPRSFLATGNVIFWTSGDPASLSEEAACRLKKLTGIDEPVFLRSVAELVRLDATRPFDRAPKGPHHERTVTFLPVSVGKLPSMPVRGPRRDVDVFAISKREAFGVTRLVDGRPGNPGPLLEKLLGVRVTTRNWNTIGRLLNACRQI